MVQISWEGAGVILALVMAICGLAVFILNGKIENLSLLFKASLSDFKVDLLKEIEGHYMREKEVTSQMQGVRINVDRVESGMHRLWKRVDEMAAMAFHDVKKGC